MCKSSYEMVRKYQPIAMPPTLNKNKMESRIFFIYFFFVFIFAVLWHIVQTKGWDLQSPTW